jgi:Kef-type K+ transport system membrane component KefB
MPAHPTQSTESLLVFILLQLIVIIGAARVFHTVFRRFGQPGVVGEIVAGLALGPTGLGLVFPGVFKAVFGAGSPQPITVISQIGLALLMFQIGADFRFGHLAERRNQRAMLAVALASLTVPFALGLVFGQLSAASLAPGIDPLTYSLFVGVAVAITAVPILGRILEQYGLTRTRVGVIAIAAAAINDVVGWVMLAGVSAYAAARFSGLHMALIVGGLILLLAGLWFVLRPLVDRLLKALPLKDGEIAPNLMAIVLCLIFALGLCTYALGVFAIFGGFMAGLLFHPHEAFVAAWKRQVGQFVAVFFLPVFFAYTGLHTNLLGLSTPSDWAWLAAVLGIAILGKIIPVYAAARGSGFDHEQSALLGSLMNTRALMELIVLNVGAELGFIPKRVFAMLVMMAVVTTIMTGPIVRRLLGAGGAQRLTEGDAERVRRRVTSA